MMRRSTTLILALAAVLVAGIVQASESPTLNAALELVHRVGSYTLRHPDAPGAFPAWAGDVVPSGEPILVHSYPGLEPLYHIIRIADSFSNFFSRSEPGRSALAGVRAYRCHHRSSNKGRA